MPAPFMKKCLDGVSKCPTLPSNPSGGSDRRSRNAGETFDRARWLGQETGHDDLRGVLANRVSPQPTFCVWETAWYRLSNELPDEASGREWG
jgi:hypothetical protein